MSETTEVAPTKPSSNFSNITGNLFEFAAVLEESLIGIQRELDNLKPRHEEPEFAPILTGPQEGGETVLSVIEQLADLQINLERLSNYAISTKIRLEDM